MKDKNKYGIPKNISPIKESVLKYRFCIDIENDLRSALQSIDITINDNSNHVEFIFRENVEGSILQLLKNISTLKGIVILVYDHNNKNPIYKIVIDDILKEKTTISFSFDYRDNDILKYSMKLECLDISNRCLVESTR